MNKIKEQFYSSKTISSAVFVKIKCFDAEDEI